MSKTFEYIHRNASIVRDATTIDDFILAFEEHLEFFKELKQAGIEIDHEESNVHADFTVFTTTDQELANKFGFVEQDIFENDDDIEPDYLDDFDDEQFSE